MTDLWAVATPGGFVPCADRATAVALVEDINAKGHWITLSEVVRSPLSPVSHFKRCQDIRAEQLDRAYGRGRYRKAA